jgi:hypothetical protein
MRGYRRAGGKTMMDRTHPPPHEYYEGDPVCGPDGRWRLWLQESESCYTADTKAGCIALAWDDYDAVTLPARVAILRELAAEIDDPERIIAMHDGQLAMAVARELLQGRKVRTLCALIADRMRERADALEKDTP